MKKIFAIILFASFALVAGAQSQVSNKIKLPVLDKSPMDMAYFPANFPILKIQEKVSEPLITRVIYSRPQKDNRKVFGELVEYNKLWRLGANEATEIEFYRDVKIDGKKVSKGRYTIYAIPTTTSWTLILNKDTDSWGAFKYDEKKDVLRVQVPIRKTTEVVEAFTITFNKSTDGMDMLIAWDDISATLPISLKL